MDSFRFMVSSLDKLASNLDDDHCKNLSEFYREEKVFRLMRHKGVYPYEYIDGWKNLRRQSYHRKMRFTAGLI